MVHDDATTRVLKEDGGRAVWVSCVEGEVARTIKSWTMTPWFAFKCLIGIAQPFRHRRGARRLRRAELSTPEVESLKLGWRNRRPVLLLAMPYIDGSTALDLLSGDLPPDARSLASRLGAVAGDLASAGFRHRDFKLSNVVIEAHSREIWLIDPVGVVHGRDQVTALACMLERLNVEVHEGLAGQPQHLPSLRRITLRAALGSMEREHRRAAVQQLREHPPA